MARRFAAAAPLLLLAAAAVCVQAASPPGPSGPIGALESLKAGQFAGWLKAVGASDDKLRKSTAILLAPTDAAVAKFLAQANMEASDLKARPEMLDAIVAYHLLPGYKVGQPAGAAAAAAAKPAAQEALRTGDVNYKVRLYRDAKTGKAWVQDAQGNNVTLGKHVKVGNLEIVPVDRVLLSGGVFPNLAAALNHYRDQWSEAAAFLSSRLGDAATNAAPDLTVFVPTNPAFKANAARLSAMTKGDAQRMFMGHATRPHRLLTPAAASARTGSRVATMLPGRAFDLAALPGDGTLKRPFSAATLPRPKFTLSGVRTVPTATAVKPYNVFVGKGTLVAIDNLLLPDAVPAPAAAAAPKAPAAKAAATGRHLLQSAQRPAWAEDGGLQNNPATTFAAANTVGALEAASSENNGVGDLGKPDGFDWDNSFVSNWESNGRR